MTQLTPTEYARLLVRSYAKHYDSRTARTMLYGILLMENAVVLQSGGANVETCRYLWGTVGQLVDLVEIARGIDKLTRGEPIK